VHASRLVLAIAVAGCGGAPAAAGPASVVAAPRAPPAEPCGPELPPRSGREVLEAERVAWSGIVGFVPRLVVCVGEEPHRAVVLGESRDAHAVTMWIARAERRAGAWSRVGESVELERYAATVVRVELAETTDMQLPAMPPAIVLRFRVELESDAGRSVERLGAVVQTDAAFGLMLMRSVGR
jgi:hypothetical protein